MFLKEIISREKHILSEIVDKKVCNSKLYEKSYVRNILLDSNCLYRVENNKQFFVEKKKQKRNKSYDRYKKRKKTFVKTERQRRRRSEQLTRRKFRRKWKRCIESKNRHIQSTLKSRKLLKKWKYKGRSSYTTIRIYKSRKNHFIRFELARFKICRSNQFINLFLKGIRTLITGKIKEKENSLILLSSIKGGFNCYSSGFRGFLPQKQLSRMFQIAFKRCKSSKDPFIIKAFIKNQKRRWFLSSPPRFRFIIKTFTKIFRFRRNNFVLSRKKKFYNSTKLLPKILFHATGYHIKKTYAQPSRL